MKINKHTKTDSHGKKFVKMCDEDLKETVLEKVSEEISNSLPVDPCGIVSCCDGSDLVKSKEVEVETGVKTEPDLSVKGTADLSSQNIGIVRLLPGGSVVDGRKALFENDLNKKQERQKLIPERRLDSKGSPKATPTPSRPKSVALNTVKTFQTKSRPVTSVSPNVNCERSDLTLAVSTADQSTLPLEPLSRSNTVSELNFSF